MPPLAPRVGQEAKEARTELPFSQPVPKTLGAVSITLWCPLQGWPSPLSRWQFSSQQKSR